MKLGAVEIIMRYTGTDTNKVHIQNTTLNGKRHERVHDGARGKRTHVKTQNELVLDI